MQLQTRGVDHPETPEPVVVLQEISAWLKLLALPRLREEAEAALTTVEERAVFAATDGRSSRDVAEVTGVPKSTVGRWWQAWRRRGLVTEDAHGRTTALVPLAELGIPPAQPTRRSRG